MTALIQAIVQQYNSGASLPPLCFGLASDGAARPYTELHTIPGPKPRLYLGTSNGYVEMPRVQFSVYGVGLLATSQIADQVAIRFDDTDLSLIGNPSQTLLTCVRLGAVMLTDTGERAIKPGSSQSGDKVYQAVLRYEFQNERSY